MFVSGSRGGSPLIQRQKRHQSFNVIPASNSQKRTMTTAAGHSKNQKAKNVEMLDEKADTAVSDKKGKALKNNKEVASKRWLGIYELQETLGGGGTSLVEIGYDPDTKQRVAIKMKKPSLGESGQNYFDTESINMQKLDHPNLTKLVDAGRAEYRTTD